MGPGGLIRVGAALAVMAGTGAASAVAEELHRHGGLPSALVAALPAMIGCAAVAAGVQLILVGWPRRRGWTVHCSSCGYQRDERGPLIVVCPECGGPWRWLGRFRMGRVVARPGAVAAGLLLCALAAAAAMMP